MGSLYNGTGMMIEKGANMRIKGMTLGSFARAVALGYQAPCRPSHVFICLADHFEPEWGGVSKQVQAERVRRWITEYPKWFGSVEDSRGRPPQHTFFYPAEVYDPDHLSLLAELCRQGFGDVEVHLHHDNDNEHRLREFLSSYVRKLYDSHGLLTMDGDGRIRFGFIHGNWALDDSHPDHRWCGVKNEIDVLIDIGCYGDFTMPAAPHAAQTSTINQIYYAVDDPIRSKSHDRGVRAKCGQPPPDRSLLMVQGPLLASRTSRRFYQTPKLENGNLSGTQPPSVARWRDWLRAAVQVDGRPDWIFIKLHTHGAKDANAQVLLSSAMVSFHRSLASMAVNESWKYYYVTSRELAMLVHQAERGLSQPDFENWKW